MRTVLLAIDANGTMIIIELKRDKTPRDVVAQAIDYASWVVNLADYQLINIYHEFAERYDRPHATLGEAFEDGGNRYLSRAWMIDPDEPTQPTARKAKKEPWNGEFYTSFGDDRPWELARRLGFIAGGGAAWYSKTLSMLSEGDRVWVNIP